MIMTNPSGNPSSSAFTANNATNSSMVSPGVDLDFPLPSTAITYHDKIDGYTGLPNPDGIFDGFTGFTTVDGFLIEHTAQIALNTYTEHPDCIEFFFTVTNTSSEARVFGLSWNVDTYIGPDVGGASGGDLAPFYVAGLRQFTSNEASVGFPILVGSVAETYYNNLTPTLFQAGFNPYTHSVPEYFYALHPTEDWSALIITNLGYKNGILWQKANYAAIAYYSYIMPISPPPFYMFGVNNGHPIGNSKDSGHMLRWDPQVVKPGETIHLAYSYGAGAGTNFQEGVINFMDQMSPAIIETDINHQFYTNAPFTSSTTIVNQTLAHILSGIVTLKIPRAYLTVENSMLTAGGWVKDIAASGSDPNYDYYTYNVGTVDPFETHLVYPAINLDVIPQCVSDINTSYWLILEVETDIPAEVVPNTIQKNLHIPKLNCSVEGQCLDLFSTGIASEGCINFEWQWLPPKPTGTYGFTLFQWDLQWNVAQLTTDTTANVCSALDLAAPNMPALECHSGNLINILSNDNGSSYRFYVKATNTTNDADTCKSNISEVINKSGLMGFYILEDHNPVGEPNASNPATLFLSAVDNQWVTYPIQDLTKCVHVQAIDSAGNLSEVAHLCDPLCDYWIITATAHNGGTITPQGTVQVLHGGAQSFLITPNAGCEIDCVFVDKILNEQAKIDGYYTFSNVVSNHTISVLFKCKSCNCR
jgi:hypothetical protein